MQNILQGLRIIEGSAFIAAPMCGTTLGQLGADVIRFDQLGGGLDFKRWPVTENNNSIYWAEMNKGKRSICVNLRSEEGRELVVELITAPGENAGIFSTNLPAKGWLSYESLSKRREDLIQHEIIGNRDGKTALDYTVNAKVGFPYLTGPSDSPEPVNHVLPAWDIATAYHAAVNILAADRYRIKNGKGQRIQLALADVALSAVSNLGLIGEVLINEEEREKHGNYLYGALGRDFVTKDQERVMIIAVSPKQWKNLLVATDLESNVADLEHKLQLDFAKEGDRFHARVELAELLESWIEQKTLTELTPIFDDSGICWDKYQTVGQLVKDDPDCSTENPIFSEITHPGIGSYPVCSGPAYFSAETRQNPGAGPLLGQNTDEVLSDILGLSSGHIGKLHDEGIVG